MMDPKLHTPKILLTPGPVTTSWAVRSSMLEDWGTWDADYLQLTQKVRRLLTDIAIPPGSAYTTTLIAGSGTSAVESVLSSVESGPLAVFINGVYGQRMVDIARRYGIPVVPVPIPESEPVTADLVQNTLVHHPEIRYVAFVHCETTTGLINPLHDIVSAAKAAGTTVLVDAVSSFGGYPIPMDDMGIDVLMTTANKCLQGVPGVGIVVASLAFMESIRGHARTISLDLYDQWRTMEDTPGKWRFTSPTQSVQALNTALSELSKEGGVSVRAARYQRNHAVLVPAMQSCGFEPYIDPQWQSYIITTFRYPTADFDFLDFYSFLKESGYLIYPGKLTHAQTFRVATIGDITEDVLSEFAQVVAQYMRG